MRLQDLSFGRKLLAVFSVLVAVAAAAGGIIWTKAEQARQGTQWTNHS